ncbi:MAG: MFS transporter [Oceanospirillales bacterium]|nr:MFS transporter [Oceanospirillales bacterium]
MTVHHDTPYASASVRWLTLLSICVATFLMPLSMSAVNVALPAIAADLNADAVLVSWIPTMNLLGAIALQLPAGRIADMVGRKKVFLAGLLLFSLSSFAVTLINHIYWLLLMRLLQGIAGAMVFGTGMAIVSQVFAQHGRGMALGLTSTSVYLGLTCGPPIGGWLTEWWDWHAVFLAPLPLAILCAVLVAIHVRETERLQDEKLDWIGSLLFIAASSLFFVGLSGLPALSGGVLAGCGLLLLAGFVYQQEHSPYPLIRLRRMVQNQVFFRSIQASFFMYAANYPLQFMLSLYLQYIRELSPAEAGQLMLLQAMMMAVLAPIAGRLSDHFDPRIPATLGCLLFASGFMVLALLDQDSSMTQIVIALLVMGTGFGLFSSPNNNGALSVVPTDRLSIASSLLNISRTMGNMLGMAVVVFLFNLMIGNAQLVPEQYPALMQLLQIAFALCGGYALMAAWRSWSRGKVR